VIIEGKCRAQSLAVDDKKQVAQHVDDATSLEVRHLAQTSD
jgi:hypothetical protein